MTRFIAAVFAVAVCAFAAPPLPPVHAQSQNEMNATAAKDYARADADLNRVYKKLAAHLDATGATKLKRAQRAWLTFRDAEMEFAADGARGGSLSPLLRYGAAARLTRERVKALTAYLTEYQSR